MRAAGGLVVFWDDRILEIIETEIGGYSISNCFKMQE